MTGDQLKFLLAELSQITIVYLMFGAFRMLTSKQLATMFSKSLHTRNCKGALFCVCSNALIIFIEWVKE